MHPRSTRNGWSPSTATWNPSASPPSERSGRGTLTPPANREEPHDELVSSRTNPRRDLVGLHCQSPDGGRRNRPARTRGNAEAGGPEAVPRARAGVVRGRGPALAFHDGRSRCQIGSADPKGSKSDNTVGSYLHRQVQMVNTSCASR